MKKAFEEAKAELVRLNGFDILTTSPGATSDVPQTGSDTEEGGGPEIPGL